MRKDADRLTDAQLARAKALRQEAMHLQKIESNPLDADDIAMFEMFEREGWSHDRCIAYIRKQAKAETPVPAAE